MLCWVYYQNKQEYVADEIGVLSPNQMEADELHAGEVTLLVHCWLSRGINFSYQNGDFYHLLIHVRLLV